MKSAPRTVGEKVERDGFCLAMVKLGELAYALGRIPAGEWDYTFTTDARWRICLNGGTQPEWKPPDAITVPRFSAGVMFNGWPAGLIDAAGGSLLGFTTEDELLAALDLEIAAVST